MDYPVVSDEPRRRSGWRPCRPREKSSTRGRAALASQMLTSSTAMARLCPSTGCGSRVERLHPFLPFLPRRLAFPRVGAALLGLTFLLGTGSAARAEPVAVRFIEGLTRGFLTVHGLDGKSLGQGDLTQLARNGRVESRMVLRLLDGSLHDEQVVFTQNKHFALVSYKLVQKGPSFPEAMEVSLTKETGEYVVQSKKGDKEPQTHRGTLELPPDTSNGLLLTLARN